MMSRVIRDKREIVEDVVKNILAWIVVTALAFVYWMAMLLLFSIFLMNVWHTNFDNILRYSIILTILTSIGYAGILLYRKLR